MVSDTVQQTVQRAVGGSVEAVARVRLYEGENGSWNYTELEGFAAVVSQGGYHTIKIVDTDGSGNVEFEQELYSGMQYQTNVGHFHHFESDEVVIGLSFGKDSEASAFGNAVKSNIPSGPTSISVTGFTLFPLFFQRNFFIFEERHYFLSITLLFS